jgi:hyperosmotically inducible protein
MRPAISLPALALAGLLSAHAHADSATRAQPALADAGQADSRQPIADTWITTKVKSELAATKGVSSTDISVTTINGMVTLTGVLDNELAVKKAVAAARSVKGVRDVDASGLKTRD